MIYKFFIFLLLCVVGSFSDDIFLGVGPECIGDRGLLSGELLFLQPTSLISGVFLGTGISFTLSKDVYIEIPVIYHHKYFLASCFFNLKNKQNKQITVPFKDSFEFSVSPGMGVFLKISDQIYIRPLIFFNCMEEKFGASLFFAREI